MKSASDLIREIDEEEKKREMRGVAEETYTRKTASQLINELEPLKELEKPAPIQQPQKQEAIKPEDKSIWTKAKESVQQGAEQFVAGAKQIPSQAKILLGLTPAIAESTTKSPLSTENLIKTYEAGIKMSEDRLSKNEIGLGREKRAMTPEERKREEEGIQRMRTSLDELYKRKEQKAEMVKPITSTFKALREEGAKESAEIAKKEQAKLLEKYGETKPWTVQWAINALAYNTPQYITTGAATIATGLITKNPQVAIAVGFAPAFAQEAASGYQEARAEGLDDEQAQKMGINKGVINGLLEVAPFGKMLSKTPAGETIKKNVINRAMKIIADRIKDGVYEGTTESMQEIVGNALMMEYKENRGLFDNVLEAGVIGGLMGSIGGGTFDLMQSVGNIQATPQNKQTKIIEQETIDVADKAVIDAINTNPEARTPLQTELVQTLQKGEIKPQAIEGKNILKIGATSATINPDGTLTFNQPLNQEDYVKYDIENKWNTIVPKEGEVKVIQTGISEYVDTEIVPAVQRGLSEDTRVFTVPESELVSTGSKEKDAFGIRILKQAIAKPEVVEKPTPIEQKPTDELEALKQEARKYKSAEEFLRNQIGDTFRIVEPVGDLWKPRGNTIFIKPNRDNAGFTRWLRDKNFIENADEAGNGIYRVTVKADIYNQAKETPILKEIKYDPSRLEKRVMPPETAGNPSLFWEAQIRYKGLAADKKAFNTEQEAKDFLKTYEFKGLNKSVAEDYEGTPFNPFNANQTKAGEKVIEKPKEEVKPAEKKVEPIKKPVTKPTPKKTEGINKLVSEDKEAISNQIISKFGKDKTLESLSAKQLTQVVDREQIIEVTDKIKKKFGTTQQAYSLKDLETREALIYGGLSRDVFTDGFLMILDKDAAKEVNELNIQKQTDKIRKNYIKTGITFDEAQALAEKEVNQAIEKFDKDKDGYFPYKSVIPDRTQMEKAEIIGFTNIGLPAYILKSENNAVVVNADKFQFVVDKVGDSNIYISKNNNKKIPVLLSRNGKDLGLVMPFKADGIETRVLDQYKKPEVTEKIPKASGYASYVSGSMTTPEQIREKLGIEQVSPIKFPEIVRITRELIGTVPAVKEPRRTELGVKAGWFKPKGDGSIGLNPLIFNDAKKMEQVLAHELGHAIDYLPEKTMARGNILGRIASLREFMRSTFTNLEVEQQIDKLTTQQKDLQSQRSALKDKDGNITNKVEYKRLGKLLTPINKEIAKIKEKAPYRKDEIYKELKSITQLWNPFNDNPSEETYQKMAEKSGQPVEAVKMMYKKYIKYRYSSPELYAEAISALFNMPDVLQTTAPNFYKGFFENLDNKPAVRDNYLKLQQQLLGGEDVLAERQKVIRESFSKGEDMIRSQREELKKRSNEYAFRLKYELIDRNQRVIDKVNQAIKSGKTINPDDNPVYWLEGHNYVGGVVKNYVEDNIQPLYQKVKEDGLLWEDLGELLFLERVIKERGDIPNPVKYLRDNAPDIYAEIEDDLPLGIEGKSTTDQLKMLKDEFNKYTDENGTNLFERMLEVFPKGLANPFGMTNETATEQLKYLEQKLGAEKWASLQEVLSGFREATNKITEMAKEEKFWSQELIKDISANPAYATFQVLDYLREYVPASIQAQKGTLKDIANPADGTVAKSISIIRAIERNKVKKKITNFMKEFYPNEIQEAKYAFDGKRRTPLEPKAETGLSLFTVIEDGALKGYYVDPYIAKTMELSSTGEMNAVVGVFRLLNNKWFRPMFITFNVGFQSFNLVRDFSRFYKNVPNMSLARAVKLYGQAAKPAFKRAWNIPDATIKEMEKNKILGVTYNDVINGATNEDKRIDAILARAGVTELKSSKLHAILKPLKIILDTIENTGNVIETLPKVAGYRALNGTLPSQEVASRIRSTVGSPDFMRRGAAYKAYNEIFLFSNAIKEGLRSDLDVAIDPKTRAGWWIKTVKLSVLPKILMWAALSGLFGEGLKKMFEDVSEYDKTNYTVIPLGEDETGKTIYIRIPQDETSRLIGGIVWKAMRMANNNRPAVQDITDLLSFTGGQLPTVNPIITTAIGTSQYLSGENPYDYFRGRNVIPDQEFKAGGMYAFKPFANWMLQTIGLNAILSGYVSEQAPETKTWIQKVIETPVLSNIVGRWVKVSDYGQTEKNRQIVKNEEQQQAQRLLEERRKVEDAVKEYQSGSQSITRKLEITRKLVKDVVGNAPYTNERKTKKTNLEKKFNIAVIKGTADSNVTSLIYANTNAEKLSLLKEIKTQLDTTKFNELKRKLIEEKIVSKDVFKELK